MVNSSISISNSVIVTLIDWERILKDCFSIPHELLQEHQIVASEYTTVGE